MNDKSENSRSTGFSEAQTGFLGRDRPNRSKLGEMPDSSRKSPPTVKEEFDPFADLVGSGKSEEAAFTADDARQRKGNYVIPFGLRGSGKTTLFASLFKFIDESPLLSSKLVVPERHNVPNYAGQAMLNNWQKIFNSGRFLGATEIGDDAIRELSYEVTPLKGQRTRLFFNVVEVSGEDLEKVVAKEGSDPRLPKSIEALLKNKNVRPLILLVVHPEQPNNDLLFHNLFVWLDRNVGSKKGLLSLGIVIANPDRALHHLHRRVPSTTGQEKLEGRLLLTYLKEFAPKTFAAYNTWEKKKRWILPLYVGKIEEFGSGEDAYEKIIRFDKRNASQLFAWLYLQFTGKRLGATFIQRIFRKLNS